MSQSDSPELTESLSKVFSVDPVDLSAGPAFPCRPLVAYSTERHTILAMFSGQIGLSAVSEFTAAMHDLFTENISKFILDFAHLSLSKSGVGALVAFANAMHGRNKRLYLYQTSDQIRSVLKDLHLTPYFTFLETEADVIVALAA